MKFNIKKEKRCQYFAPDNASTTLFSTALNEHITCLNKKYEDLVLLCIGTDKITGDCLGPLVGSKLKQRNFPHPLYGTLEKPLHAGNLTEHLPKITNTHPDACVLAIDAAVGSPNHIGLVSLACQPLFPGKGVSRTLAPVGNISITGIINECSASSEILLPYTSLYLVDKLAEYICNGIQATLNGDLPQAGRTLSAKETLPQRDSILYL